ncbi:MAG: hypothetical protein VX574_00335 [Myxococcota bacterium]|nr:hypothetical protein [Myxococcota bacterium]
MPSRLRFSMTWAASLALVFAFAAAPASAAADDSDRITALESQVQMLMDEIKKMQAEKEVEKAAEAAAEDVTVAPNPELQENIGALAREMERIKRAVAIPEETGLKSMYGKGPAASKVYTKDQGLSIGGYGEGNFSALVADKHGRDNVAEWLRGVIYAGYKFNDWIVINTEIEFEHASTGRGGSASVEFAELDFFIDERVNVATGLLLTPMGFINEIHEPTEYYGVSRPSPETQIIPSTWREIGAGLFGSFFDDTLSYKLYAMNGMDASGFTSSGYRGGRQKGRAKKANDWAIVARLDWIPTDGLLVGGSVWSGGSGQGRYDFGNVWTTIFEVHAEYEWQGLKLRALYTQSHVADAGDLTNALGTCNTLVVDGKNNDYKGCIAKRSLGGYFSVGYNVLPWIFPDTEMSLEPFYRFEWTETQNKMPSGVFKYGYQNFRVNMVGLQFYPHPQVVIKADYRNVHALGRNASNNQRPHEFQLGVGYVF